MEKPTKKIIVRKSEIFDFNWVSKKVSLDYFFNWCKDNTPPNAKDVTLELVEKWEYGDCLTYLEISWDQEISNPHYEKEMKKWQKIQNKK